MSSDELAVGWSYSPSPSLHLRNEGKETEEAKELEDVKGWCEGLEWNRFALVKRNETNRTLHELARYVKAFEVERGKDISPRGFGVIFECWRKRNSGFLKPNTDYLSEFIAKMMYVRYPAGQTLARALAAAKEKETVSGLESYPSGGLRIFAALCRELAMMSGDGTLTLGQSAVAKLFDCTPQTVSNWIAVLRKFQYLEVVEKHTPKMRATRYRFRESC